MKAVFFIFLLTTIFSTINAKDSNSGKNEKFGDITVIIENLDTDEGIMLSQLFYLNYNDKEDYPTKSDKAFRKQCAKMKDKKTKIVYENVPYGTYALCTHQDINNNGKMDKTFFGFPAEPYGLSNNPTIYFSIPTFDECKFEVNQKNTIVKLIMKK